MTRFTRIVSAAAILAFTFHLIADSRKVLKVAITAGGQITADGHPTTLEALIPMLRELAKNKGEVWYYREVPEADPHPNAMKVLEAIGTRISLFYFPQSRIIPTLSTTKDDRFHAIDVCNPNDLTMRWSESLPGVTFRFSMTKTVSVAAMRALGSDRSSCSR